MNKRLYFYIIFFFIFLSCNIFASDIELTAVEKDFLKQHPVIKVNNSLDSIPFNFCRDGSPQGYSVDLMKILADRLGITVEFINGYSWNQFTEMLKKHDIDAMLNIAKTDEREEYAIFTKPILKFAPSIICKKENNYSSIESLQGRTVAIVEGYWYYDNIKQYFPEINLITVKYNHDTLKAVAYGKAEATIGNGAAMQCLWMDNNISNLKISGEALLPKYGSNFECIGIRKDWPVLKGILDKAIDSLTINEIMKLKKKWLDFANNRNRLNLTEEETAYLARKGKITMCVDPDFMPYEGLKNGRHIGIAADFFKEFQRKLTVPVEIIQTSSWTETLKYAQEKKCDIISLLNQSPERSKYLDFTVPYLTDPIVIVSRNDVFYIEGLESLSGKTVAITRGYYMIDVISRNFPDIKVLEAESPSDALKKVSTGKAFANIASILAATRAIKFYGFNNLQIAGHTGLRDKFRIGVIRENPLLLSIMNKVINSIEEKTSNEISQHWYSLDMQESTGNKIIWKILLVAIICIVLLIVIIIFYKRYNTKITESNITLQQKNNELTVLRTRLEENIKELNNLAVTDKLTGLFNRVKIDQVLNEELKRVHRFKHCFGIILLDIDLFKNINDTFGHQFGDKILINFSEIIQHHTRETDITGRWGGEEFIIICPEIDKSGIQKLAEKLRSIIEKTDFIAASSLTASFGTTLIRDNSDSITRIISRADKALYQSKRSGRNQVQFME